MSGKMLTTKQAAVVIGVSADVFRGVVKKLRIKPDRYYIALHKKRWPLWYPASVESIASSDPMQEALGRKEQRRSELPSEVREIEEIAEGAMRDRILKKTR
jgi:hypothetical protein